MGKDGDQVRDRATNAELGELVEGFAKRKREDAREAVTTPACAPNLDLCC
jgi:hypothetical protein